VTTDYVTDQWGADPFGIYGAPPGQLAVVAISENLVRLWFPVAVYWTGVGDPSDGSIASKYVVTTLGGIGLDGLPPRNVSVVQATQVGPAIVDVTLDRPLSPYPCQYTMALNGLVSVGMGPIIGTKAFGALQSGIPLPAIDTPTASRDIAHPDTLNAQLDPLPGAGDQTTLGGIPVDATADYAYDEGVVSYTKRVWRRLLTVPDGFSHLANYGAGVLTYVKKLARPSTRQALASKCEQQILQEPESVRARVTFAERIPGSGLWDMRIVVKTTQWGAIKFEGPLVSA
jgi:hypothetical protein